MLLEGANSMEYVELLKTELVNKLRKNPSYSQRAFAKYLGLAPGELSEILNRKRPLSLKKGIRISDKLGLSQVENDKFLASIQGKDINNNLETRELTIDLFSILSDYVPFAIINLYDCNGFRWDNQWIATKLGVHTYEVELAIERLMRVGLIKAKNGKLYIDNDYVISPSETPSRAIRNYHATMLNKALASLEDQPIDKRDISGIGLAITHEQIPQIKKEISEYKKFKKQCCLQSLLL